MVNLADKNHATKEFLLQQDELFQAFVEVNKTTHDAKITVLVKKSGGELDFTLKTFEYQMPFAQ